MSPVERDAPTAEPKQRRDGGPIGADKANGKSPETVSAPPAARTEEHFEGGDKDKDQEGNEIVVKFDPTATPMTDIE